MLAALVSLALLLKSALVAYAVFYYRERRRRRDAEAEARAQSRLAASFKQLYHAAAEAHQRAEREHAARYREIQLTITRRPPRRRWLRIAHRVAIAAAEGSKVAAPHA